MGSLFLNTTEDFVEEAIEGAVACTPHLQRLDGFPQVDKNSLCWVLTLPSSLKVVLYTRQLTLPDAGEGTFRWGGRQEQGGSYLG